MPAEVLFPTRSVPVRSHAACGWPAYAPGRTITLMRIQYRVSGSLLALLALASPLRGQDPSWSEPFPAFRVVGNLYYVGSKGLASYLVATPQGHILINGNLES